MPAAMLAIQQSLPYEWALVFFAAYPIVTSIMWISTAMLFRWRWEPAASVPPPRLAPWPFVSVLVPARNEQAVIAGTVAAALRLDYPEFEVIVIDDGSSDGTLAALAPLRADARLRVVHKTHNEGKALALNDALPLARGEIVMCLDADAEPDAAMLRWLVPHFDAPRVAAVTGNPRVVNTGSFLARLQAIEFSSIISLMRRAQRIWGRIVTVSGVVAAFRKSALLDVGGFSPEMPTEDIDMTWKLQKRFYDVRYEPRALCWMTVPLSLRGLFRQRLRWARGLMRVLRRHADVATHWRLRRLWPVFVESWLSILWALCFVVLTLLWCLSIAIGLPPVGATPIPSLWGMAIASFCLLQLLTGALIDRRYDPGILRLLPYAVWYPVAYWAFLTLTTVLALPTLWRTPAQASVRWETQREGRAA
jgi:biofilm PGA synthesis N-glycosyltransferase PgaC